MDKQELEAVFLAGQLAAVDGILDGLAEGLAKEWIEEAFHDRCAALMIAFRESLEGDVV